MPRKPYQPATKKKKKEAQRADEHVENEVLKDSPGRPRKRGRDQSPEPCLESISSPSSTGRRPVRGICYNCAQNAHLAITHDEDVLSNASRRRITDQAGPSEPSRLPITNLESRLDRLRLTDDDGEVEFNTRLNLSVNVSVDCRQMPVQMVVDAPPPYDGEAPEEWPQPMDVDPPYIDIPELFENLDNGRASLLRDRKARRVDRKGHSKQRAKLSRGSDERPLENPSRSRYDPLARVGSSGKGIIQRLRSPDPFIAAYARYQHACKAFDDNFGWGIRFSEVPWPVSNPPKTDKDITVEEVQSFFRLAKVPPSFKFLSVSPSELKDVVRRELEDRWSEVAIKDLSLRLRDGPREGDAALAAAATVQAALRSLVGDN